MINIIPLTYTTNMSLPKDQFLPKYRFRKKVILIDMDNTIADLSKSARQKYEERGFT